MFQSKVGGLYQNKRTTGLNARRLLTGMYENISICTDDGILALKAAEDFDLTFYAS
eukprot:IDg7224t1